DHHRQWPAQVPTERPGAAQDLPLIPYPAAEQLVHEDGTELALYRRARARLRTSRPFRPLPLSSSCRKSDWNLRSTAVTASCLAASSAMTVAARSMAISAACLSGRAPPD